MVREYSDCFYCGGTVEERLTPREFIWRGQLFIFENVPMGVCSQCGEKVLKPEVAKAIDHIIQEQEKPTKTIEVPVYSLGTRRRLTADKREIKDFPKSPSATSFIRKTLSEIPANDG